MGLPDMDDGWEADDERPFMTPMDEAALEEYEENKRRKIAEANEY